ncbi:MAG: four helix bundle protein [Chthoniobacterales bacterium]
MSDELRKRTKAYASTIIRLYVSLPRGREEVAVIGRQLLRSGTSVAAHAREASRARSDGEFCSKLDGLLQEADESELWLELLGDDCGISNPITESLLGETSELLAIFGDDREQSQTQWSIGMKKLSFSAFQGFSFSIPK